MKKNYRRYNSDPSKLTTAIEHEYHPLKKDEDVYVVVDHLKNGDLINFMDMENREIDYAKMFLKKVKSVHGVTIEDAEGNEVEATKHDIVNISDPDFLAIVMGTCMHLLDGLKLTEEESKN